MLSYTNDMPEMIDQFSDIDEEIITYDFLARKFFEGAQKLFERGLVRDYVEFTEETGVISGKMMMNESIPFIMERKPLVVCEKDEYSSNILLNQIMKTTLKDLFQNPHIDEKTRNESYSLWEQIPDVDCITLSKLTFVQMRFYRYDIHYKQMIHLARLLYELKLLSHRQGDWSLFTVHMDEGALNRLFETFLLNFYRHEQKDYRVKSERLQWKLSGNAAFLPSMLTDVSLTHRKKQKKIIIDAKFYKNMFQVNYDKISFHSGNMYQMFTYLNHQPNELEQLRGILIYPFNGQEINEVYQWDDRMKMEVLTVNLGEKWHEIYQELMDVVKDRDS